ncbi:20S proteasome subunit alpha 4 [Nematocida major]|uniref:20S proteasome subunit alpha 4 n=1 Tax=Nematocida major TaxID=1912982 RepID=UPI0020075A65|nr:20S proteasome subunit alpha 4 [Nematocida major]KAH9386782.1 20S proteasome subunit alpha 4 [Nematocida major]
MAGGKYDRALSIFSPDGRIFQVEYAQLAAERGSPVIFYSDGKTISVAIEKRAESKHKVLSDLDKFKEVETGIYLTFAGIWPDSLIIIDKAVFIAREYAYRIGETIDIMKLSLELSDFIQKYTITGGYRPFGVKVVLLGFYNGSSVISMIEPDGNYALYKGGAIGAKSEKAIKELEGATSESPTVAVAKALYTVAQKDAKKMSLFEITEEVATILPQDHVSQIIESFSQ